MKVFMCCVFMIANISNNGKASLESFAPTLLGTNILFEDTTRNSDHVSCYRPCKFNVKPKQCHYRFKIEPTFEETGRPALTINGMTPGPPIQACVNDIVIVEVENRIPDQDIALHWHGVEQKATPYMDGVPMVTQCPIGFGQKYKYAFVASTPGTFFYHSDSVSHQSDGVYGALIINQPQPLEPHSALYDYDRSGENTLLIAAKFPELLTAKLEDISRLRPDALIINGDERTSKIFVLPSFAYRLRFVNAIAIECPVTMSIENHEMMIITSDDKPTKPVSAWNVELYPGERMDVVVRASEDGGGYWVRTRGRGVCAGLQANAMLIYSGFNYTSMLQENLMEQNIPVKESHVVVGGQMLESLQDQSYNTVVKFAYLGIDRNIVKINEDDHDFRYISDAIPKKPFFPASLSLREDGIVQINGKSFLYPSLPILLKPNDVKVANMICKVGEENRQIESQCVYVLDAVEGELLEIALVNEGFGSNDSYTFHMHGYKMQVVATWQNPKNKPISKQKFDHLNKDGKILRNLQNPPLKDTVTVPNKGYTIVRMKIDYGGSWLLECRSCGLSSLPTAVIVRVPQLIPKPVLDSLPQCGNYRPPDVLLN